MKRFVLDACALLALLRDEEGADIVADAINSASIGESEIIMHKANLLEVYYDIFRSLGESEAVRILDEIHKRPIIINSEITNEIFAHAGKLKASYKISFADSFALAQSIVSGGELLTADHHEFDPIEGNEPIRFFWIR
jgi:predicted nucleic acid-binding protein